jgi:hypothetical protein
VAASSSPIAHSNFEHADLCRVPDLRENFLARMRQGSRRKGVTGSVVVDREPVHPALSLWAGGLGARGLAGDQAPAAKLTGLHKGGFRTRGVFSALGVYLEPGSTSPRCGLSIASSNPMRRADIGTWVSASYWAFRRRSISRNRNRKRCRLSLAANNCSMASPCRPSYTRMSAHEHSFPVSERSVRGLLPKLLPN